MPELCIHDLPVTYCGLCRGRRRDTAMSSVAVDWELAAELAAEAAVSGLGVWITSRYSGTCRGCGWRWEPGDKIRWSDDEQSYLCAVCGIG
jgi:hypothetical protein